MCTKYHKSKDTLFINISILWFTNPFHSPNCTKSFATIIKVMAKLIDKDQEYYALKIKILLPHFVPNEEIGRNTKEEKKTQNT